MENFLTNLSGFLTPVIAGIMVYIAYRQYKTDRDKLKWNLYEKRMEVFQSLRDLIRYITQEANVSSEELNKFAISIDKGSFLFDSKMNDYLSGIRDKCFSLREHRMKLGNRNLGVGAERSRLAKENEEIMLWFCGQYEEAKKLFEEYLKINK
jgi:hypothetical protein